MCPISTMLFPLLIPFGNPRTKLFPKNFDFGEIMFSKLFET